MKTYISIFLFIFLLIGCDPNNAGNNNLESKQGLLKDKKAQLSQLLLEIEKLESDISILNPVKMKESVLVNTIPIKRTPFERYVEFYGTVIAENNVNVSSETGGRIISVKAKEGDKVRKGQLLVKIDMEPVVKQMDEIKTSLELAQEVWERQKRLWDQEIGSEIQYLQAKNNKERLEKSLEVLETQLKKQNIYSPINGIIENEILKSGETAGPAKPILQIINIDQVKVEADIAESYIGQLKPGDNINLYFPSLDTTIRSKVDQIGTSIDAANRTFKITAIVPNRANLLKPNLLTIVKFRDYYEPAVIQIPVDYILEEVDGRKFIYVVEMQDSLLLAMKQYIETGESSAGQIIVTTSLDDGVLMITDGVRSVSHANPIKISE